MKAHRRAADVLDDLEPAERAAVVAALALAAGLPLASPAAAPGVRAT